MTWWWLSDQVISAALTAVLSLIIWFFQARVRLVWTETHRFNHLISGKEFEKRLPPLAEREIRKPANDISVSVATVMVTNRGRLAAEDVEISMTHKPLGFAIWPQRGFREGITPTNWYVIRLDGLAGRETIAVHMLDFSNLPIITDVRGKGIVAKLAASQPAILYPKRLIWTALFFMVFGGAAAMWIMIYGAILVLRGAALWPW